MADERLNAATRAQRASRAGGLVTHLSNQGVVAVALSWIDNSGINRVKAVPLGRLEQAATWGIGMSPVFDAFLTDDSIVAGRHAGGPLGDLRLHPDLDRLVVLDQQPGWAWAPADRYTHAGVPHVQDARSLARRAVATLKERGLSVIAAFEVEWAVSMPGAAFSPAVSGPAYGFTRLIERSDYLRDLVMSLQRQGVAIEQIHPEYSAGQFEVSVAAEDPVGAADTAVLIRETIRACTQRHGMQASFSPKMVVDGAGNGGHVHLSLWRAGRNVMAGGSRSFGLTGEGEAFAAGILARLPALLAIGAPSPASYLRLIPQHWAGAFQAWGLENRETALRFVRGPVDGDGAGTNLEVKAFDLAANPYLVVAALTFAGLAGVDAGDTLPPPVDIDPASLTAAELETRGIVQLPTSLAAATDAFEAEPALCEAFGVELAATVADVRRAEIARFAAATDDDIVSALLWTY